MMHRTVCLYLCKVSNRTPIEHPCFAIEPLRGENAQNRYSGSKPSTIGLKVYPSPTVDGFVTLELPISAAIGGDFSLTDVAGKVWVSQRIKTGQTIAQLDVSSMPNGLYFYAFRSIDGKSYTGKIIVQNN